MHDDDFRKGLSRREFLKEMSIVAVGAGGLVYATPLLAATKSPTPTPVPAAPIPFTRARFSGKCIEDAKPAFAIPGRFPGRVVEVHHPGSVANGHVAAEPVGQMVARGMTELTGAPDATAAWRSMFQKGDRVGIKVNAAGLPVLGKTGSISNYATIVAIVKGLGSAGIAPKEIVLLERYADDFRRAGYEKFLNRELPEVKWFVSSTEYDHPQLALDGRHTDRQGKRAPADPHVLGYDPEFHQKFDFYSPKYHDPKNPECYLSHVSKIMTGDLVNKIINIPVLKDHRCAGITMALKNISHGFMNNVDRTHHGKGKDGNHTGMFIPRIVALEPFRKKVVLNIMDGLIGVYEGGPVIYYNSWSTWEYKSLFFSTDPVAMDRVGWDILDAERARNGWQPVANMGLHGNNRSGTEQHWLRQPEHVTLAAELGLGIFDPARIEHLRVEM